MSRYDWTRCKTISIVIACKLNLCWNLKWLRTITLPLRTSCRSKQVWSAQTLAEEVSNAFPLTIFWEFLLFSPRESQRTCEWKATSSPSKEFRKATVSPIWMTVSAAPSSPRTMLLGKIYWTWTRALQPDFHFKSVGKNILELIRVLAFSFGEKVNYWTYDQHSLRTC